MPNEFAFHVRPGVVPTDQFHRASVALEQIPFRTSEEVTVILFADQEFPDSSLSVSMHRFQAHNEILGWVRQTKIINVSGESPYVSDVFIGPAGKMTRSSTDGRWRVNASSPSDGVVRPLRLGPLEEIGISQLDGRECLSFIGEHGVRRQFVEFGLNEQLLSTLLGFPVGAIPLYGQTTFSVDAQRGVLLDVSKEASSPTPFGDISVSQTWNVRVLGRDPFELYPPGGALHLPSAAERASVDGPHPPTEGPDVEGLGHDQLDL